MQKHEILPKSEGIGSDPVGQHVIFRHKLPKIKMGSNFQTEKKKINQKRENEESMGYDNVGILGNSMILILTVDLYTFFLVNRWMRVFYS